MKNIENTSWTFFTADLSLFARARKSRLSLFADLANARPDAIPTFAIDVKEKAGPLCVFGTKASPEGLKPLKPKDASAVDKALCKHDLFHGGEQGLFAAHATLDAKPCLLALTSLGRLFAVAGGIWARPEGTPWYDDPCSYFGLACVLLGLPVLLARAIAGQSVVLLTNERSALPLGAAWTSPT